MRKVIASLQMTLDGFIEGPNGELDWAKAEDGEFWRETFETLNSIDALILGRGMYPGYEQYWLEVLRNPDKALPFSGTIPTKNEIEYARNAEKIPHLVLSRTLEKVEWKATRIVRDAEEIRKIKQQPGKDMIVLGGANLVSNLLNLGIIDEVRLLINPLVLGEGKALFKDVKDRHGLKLLKAKPLHSGKIDLRYSTQSE